MRKIEFRGLHYNPNTKKSNFVYGDLVKNRYSYNKHTVIEGFDLMNKLVCWTIKKSETVGQFTGLKDKNGKKIYEGDIVKTPYNDVYDFAYYEITYREDRGMFWQTCRALHHKKEGFKDISNGGYCEGDLNCKKEELEVIGNIYKNPKLLEGKRCIR